VRVLGVDPGTKSFDLVLVEDGRVVWEASVATERVARDPSSLIEAIRDAGSFDAMAAPSGYGVPFTSNSDIIDARRFAVEVLLLSSEEALRRGLERGEPGIMVYVSLAEAVEWIWRSRLPAYYIPGVIQLPTVPPRRKFNRVDMGTADKLAVTALALHLYSRERGVGPGDASFILVEAGYGYNAVIAVDRGVVVDGYGGTFSTTGFLTIGPVDAEAAAAGGCWERSDVFHGGVSEACGTLDPFEALELLKRGIEPCSSALESMFEGLARLVTAASLVSTRGRARDVLVSGRLAGMVAGYLEQLLPEGFRVERLGLLEGAEKSKHAAQGYALVVEGALGGVFRGVVERMRVRDACGTVFDYLVHPRLREARERLRRAYAESVRNPKFCC